MPEPKDPFIEPNPYADRYDRLPFFNAAAADVIGTYGLFHACLAINPGINSGKTQLINEVHDKFERVMGYPTLRIDGHQDLTTPDSTWSTLRSMKDFAAEHGPDAAYFIDNIGRFSAFGADIEMAKARVASLRFFDAVLKDPDNNPGIIAVTRALKPATEVQVDGFIDLRDSFRPEQTYMFDGSISKEMAKVILSEALDCDRISRELGRVPEEHLTYKAAKAIVKRAMLKDENAEASRVFDTPAIDPEWAIDYAKVHKQHRKRFPQE